MAFMLVLLLIIVFYKLFISRDLLHPFLYFLIPWVLVLGTSVLDLYAISGQISSLAVEIVCVGLFAFIIGVSILPKTIGQTLSKHFHLTNPTQLRTGLLKVIIIFSAAFNLYMAFLTMQYIGSGISYAFVRDLIYSYSDSGATYFQSTFALNLYNLFDVPFTYIVMPLIIINLFKPILPRYLKYLAILSVAAYVFASGGRLIILFAAFQVVAILGYYKQSIPWRKYILAFVVGGVLLILVGVTTLYRAKQETIGSAAVNPAYAYFNIVMPILSRWTQDVSVSGVQGHGLAFFNGFMQLLDLVLNKIGYALTHYESIATMLTMPQNNWLQIYPGKWYNAFSSLFYDFYVDFRIPGVVVGSFIFGLLSKFLYLLVKFSTHERFLLPYLVLVEVMAGSFMRWQLGTYTFLSAFLVAFFVIKGIKKQSFGEEIGQ